MGDIERPYVTSYSGRGTPYATRYALPRLDRDRWTSYQEKEVCFIEMFFFLTNRGFAIFHRGYIE